MLSKKEKEVIEDLKECENCHYKDKENCLCEVNYVYKRIILGIIEKQQKEIEKLKEHLNQYYDGKLFTANQLKVIEKEQNKYFIHKDKIKEKIKEIEDSLKEDCIALHEFQRLAKIDILKKLLGDE